VLSFTQAALVAKASGGFTWVSGGFTWASGGYDIMGCLPGPTSTWRLLGRLQALATADNLKPD